MLRAVEYVTLFLWHRLVGGPALRSPIAIGGLVFFLVSMSWEGALTFLSAAMTSYFAANGRLFREAARQKENVAEFINKYAGMRWTKVPTHEFVQLFDVSFLVPSYIRPEKLVRYVAKRRVQVHTVVRRGNEKVFGSPCAFASPIAQDVYVFLRDSLATMKPAIHFRVAHELGHASGMYCAVAQRNLLAMQGVYLSIAWVFLASSMTLGLVLWSLLQLTLAWVIKRTIFRDLRKKHRALGEIIADYMALRHLSEESVAYLADSGVGQAIIQQDPALSKEETALRRSILVDALQQRRRGEDIDVPLVVQRDAFVPPVALAAFLLLHLGYLFYFASRSMPPTWATIAFPCCAAMYFLVAVSKDAKYRVAIDRRLESLRSLPTDTEN